jgi:hypothetical protein
MSKFYAGVYWKDRSLTLRQYADLTRDFFVRLQEIHPVFRTLEWVGDRPNSEIEVSPDLANLDDLIYRHAGSRQRVYSNPNPDGTPSWSSAHELGFGMRYGTHPSNTLNSVEIGIRAGMSGERFNNAVTLGFPVPSEAGFLNRDFYDYDFLKKLFSAMRIVWKPQFGLVVSDDFSDVVEGKASRDVGWMTYVRDQRALALRNDSALKGLIVEEAPDGGVLLSLGHAIISPENTEQVELARLLRRRLISEKLIGV